MALYRDLLCTFCAILAACIGLSAAQSERTGCTDTRQAYRDKGFSVNEVPHSAITGDDLRVCPTGYTCCTLNMESQLTQTSSAEFENVVYDKSSMLRDYFIRRTERFDNFIKELIDNSQDDLHEMFVLTYGTLYEQYKEMFDELYTSFRNYYHGVDLDLSQVMDDFFAKLFERMFQLMYPQYRYTDEFWECTSQYLASLKPFNDVPSSLRERAKRSFVAARTFVQGLGIGRDVVTRGTKVEPTPGCRKALMRMSYCPHCKGIPYVKPCHSFCLNIMKGCLASQAEVDAEWNYFIDAITMLGTRMEGILNIETFMTTLDIEISNAIMNMQNNGVAISKKVFNGCGVPSMQSRNRREADDEVVPLEGRMVREAAASPDEVDPPKETATVFDEDAEDLGIEDEEMVTMEMEKETDVETAKVGYEKVTQSNETEDEATSGLRGRQGRRREGRQRVSGITYNPSPTTAAGTSLDRLIKDVLKRLRDSRPFWPVLPYMICDDTEIAADVMDENCWNGNAVGRYEHDLVSNGIQSQERNPEVDVDTSRPSATVRTQVAALRMVTQQLQSAYEGEDVVWIDNGGMDDDYSGSGSGSGSGDHGGDPNDNNLFPFSTPEEDPLYRPTKEPREGGAESMHAVASIVLSLLAATCAAMLRW